MKSKKLSILAGVALALGAYDAQAAQPTLAGVQYAESDTKAMPAEPDNSGRNVRDQDDKTLTPTDQSSDPADVDLTQRIRKSITSNDAMSVDARNIKIITQGGVVTLRGPVKTTDEKTQIELLAKNAGAKSIDNQLEIDRDGKSGAKE
jgi:osmotically-inducible protein OsmY